jgi:hypothetical protein
MTNPTILTTNPITTSKIICMIFSKMIPPHYGEYPLPAKDGFLPGNGYSQSLDV